MLGEEVLHYTQNGVVKTLDCRCRPDPDFAPGYHLMSHHYGPQGDGLQTSTSKLEEAFATCPAMQIDGAKSMFLGWSAISHGEPASD